MASLTLKRSDGQHDVFELAGAETTIGREAGQTVRIDSTYTSKRHAAIRLGPQGYSIIDLGSSNGTWVNGTQVAVALLKDGDAIEIGGEKLIFADRQARAALKGGARKRWLLLAAGASAAALLVAAVFIVIGSAPDSGRPGGGAPADPRPTEPVVQTSEPPPGAALPPAEARPSAPGDPGVPAPQPAQPVAEPIAQGSAGNLPTEDADTLYDLALAAIKGNRLVEARRLLVASVTRDPSNPSARQRLQEVEGLIVSAIDRHLAAGQRAFTYLRFEDAIQEWEQVLAMTDSSNPKHQEAAAGLARARERLGR